MMTLLWILLMVIVLSGLGALGLSQMYRNPRIPHRRTPAAVGIAFEEVRFPTKNNRSLYGWWIPAAGSSAAGSSTKESSATEASATDTSAGTPTLILVHGWGRNLQRLMDYIENLHPRGFNLLAFDSRNHGSSDRDRFSSMLKFAEDIMAAVDFAVELPQVDPERIGVIGLSIGGAATVYAAAHDPRIEAGVTVGAFAHPADVMEGEFTRRHVPSPLIATLFRYFEWRIGATFDAIAPENNISNAKARFLIIHGDQDKVVPVRHARRLVRTASQVSAELWILPGKGHSDCHTHPGFWQRVVEFLSSGNVEHGASAEE